jgi:hypothetical protein
MRDAEYSGEPPQAETVLVDAHVDVTAVCETSA